MGKLISDESRSLFPIKTIDGLVKLFENEFINPPKNSKAFKKGPNIALASIILGSLEHSIIQGQKSNPEDQTKTAEGDFPAIDYDTVTGLFEKFKTQLFPKLKIDALSRDRGSTSGTSREMLRHVSDIIWEALPTSYMSDKAHLQSLYTYVTGEKLDSFGYALSVIAACQILELNDVHLCLSEDHVWATFGLKEEQSAEITWRGKKGEDKRGRVIENTTSWLYLKGNAVKCTDRYMEIAAIVCSINVRLTPSTNSQTLEKIMQELLWKLYEANHLQRYPMALGNLAELEAASPTPGKVNCESLYKEAITSSCRYYNNLHVYPYIYYSDYLFKKKEFKEVLNYWAKAADVISNYSYNQKLDEEIYKVFLDICQDELSSMMKQSTGISAYSLIRDPHCIANLLKFFDGLCLWEEGASAPVLHVVWAKCWAGALSKFEFAAREGVRIVVADAGKSFHDLNGNDPTTSLPDSTTSNTTITVVLKSFKMKGIKTLLQSEKFNPSTFSLQITSQPTVQVNSTNEIGIGGRSRNKRSLPSEKTPTGSIIKKSDSELVVKRKR